ncbi:MAG TPA: RNase adapter RapZ [Steroidobacteraceae bacterium]|nr:RNase adapter RapZ [Steroidobacteraceae bacterium]
MRLIIVSGLSGSGKSVALHMLEDLDFYCIDNIPAALLKPFISHTVHASEADYSRAAVGLDARNATSEIASVPTIVGELRRSGITCEVLFLQASDEELLNRFGETRRKHPMSRDGVSLREAIAAERRLLEPVTDAADLVIDTTRMSVHELRELLRKRVEQRSEGRLSIMFESFGFKHGIPGDADFVFDVRSLPNPYWEPTLRAQTGRDAQVIAFLESNAAVQRMIDDISGFLDKWIPEYQRTNRSYLTVAIGCTGGQHRSVYITDRLAAHFATKFCHVLARHNALPDTGDARSLSD